MWIFVLLLILVYTAFVSLLAAGIIKLYRENKGHQPAKTRPRVNVIIPFRDEAHSIKKLIHDLVNQTWPSSHFQVFFVDDHSTDGGDIIISQAIKKHNLNAMLLHLPADKTGKKAALLTGLNNSTYDYILTTDADCRVSPNWIKSMMRQAALKKSDLLLGPVIHVGKSGIGRLQSAESLSLLAVTMGTAGIGTPVLSNAANMAIKREMINRLHDPFKAHVSSGDDIFLMETLKANKNPIAFNADREALVTTNASESWKKFIQQRARWMSKTKHYHCGSSKFTMFVFGGIQIGFIVSIPVLIVHQAFITMLFLWMFKILYDNLLMYLVSLKYKIPFGLTDNIIFSAIYPFWTVVTTLVAYNTKPLWKGRAVKH